MNMKRMTYSPEVFKQQFKDVKQTRELEEMKHLQQIKQRQMFMQMISIVNIDKKIYAFCHSKGIAYTRYADDLTFSSMRRFEYGQLMGYVEMVMRNEKFTINNEKT
jgi:hypothetical protein